MAERWENFVDQLQHGAGFLAKEELKRLIADAKGDSSPFVFNGLLELFVFSPRPY